MSDLARYHTSMKFDPKPSLVENESATSKRNNSRVPAPNLGKANKIKGSNYEQSIFKLHSMMSIIPSRLPNEICCILHLPPPHPPKKRRKFSLNLLYNLLVVWMGMVKGGMKKLIYF